MKQENYSLLAHNTFGIDVKAACFLEYHSVDELRRMVAEGLISEPYLHIGGGSNLLFTKDYPGTVLHSCIGGIEIIGETVKVSVYPRRLPRVIFRMSERIKSLHCCRGS